MSSQQTIKYLFSIVVLMKYERQALSNIYGTIALFPFFQKKKTELPFRDHRNSVFLPKMAWVATSGPKHMINTCKITVLPPSFLGLSFLVLWQANTSHHGHTSPSQQIHCWSSELTLPRDTCLTALMSYCSMAPVIAGAPS